MAENLDALKSKITELVQSTTDLKAAVVADKVQVATLVTEVSELISAINSSGNTDFTQQIADVQSAIDGVKEAQANLAADNPDIQAAIDAANTAETPGTPTASETPAA